MCIRDSARTMPAAIDQNRNAMSSGSLIAVRKRTIESAPTIPKERTIFEVTARITSVVIITRAINVTPKFEEYITPANVLDVYKRQEVT